MKKSSPRCETRFPWHRLSPGQGFFVPCLDTDKTAHDGLAAATRLYRLVHVQATPGVFRGRFGVLFSVKPNARLRRA
jgi:hypothetical protein